MSDAQKVIDAMTPVKILFWSERIKEQMSKKTISYLTDEELDNNKAVPTELMEISNDGLAKVVFESIVDN